MSKELTIKVSPNELSKVEENILNPMQLQVLLRKTPANMVRERPAKGGGKWKYVAGGYVKKVLNLLFGWDWDFEIVNDRVADGEVVVTGRLTCRSNGRTIVKMQYGNKEIMYRKGTEKALSIGNDLKAAATDALKKCAAELGIAADIYNAEEFRVVDVDITDFVKEKEDKKFNIERDRLLTAIENGHVPTEEEKEKYGI